MKTANTEGDEVGSPPGVAVRRFRQRAAVLTFRQRNQLASGTGKREVTFRAQMCTTSSVATKMRHRHWSVSTCASESGIVLRIAKPLVASDRCQTSTTLF
jgi:hypothetical protein